MRKTLFLVLFALLCASSANAQTAAVAGKVSPYLRLLGSQKSGKAGVRNWQAKGIRHTIEQDDARPTTVFLRHSEAIEAALDSAGGKVLAEIGDIAICTLPYKDIERIARLEQVSRIEAAPSAAALLDRTSEVLIVDKAHEGTDLPQAFTGRGVIIGVEDIGFDLTHPNFQDPATGNSRILSLWDVLDTTATVTGGYEDYAGRLYRPLDVTEKMRSFDGEIMQHGTHTLGIAAGNGAGTKFRGIAPESEIVLVSNATSNNKALFRQEDELKYTSALDVLGFKHIFDQAQREQKPCVISFSEGEKEGFDEDYVLYFEALRRLQGKGRIIVAAAGNESTMAGYVPKPQGKASAGCFLQGESDGTMGFQMLADRDFTLRFTAYNEGQTSSWTLETEDIATDEWNTNDTLFTLLGKEYRLGVLKFPSALNAGLTAYYITLESQGGIGTQMPLSIEILGSEAAVEMFRRSGTFRQDEANPLLQDAVTGHNILAPSAAEGVISVGATTWRSRVVNTSGHEVGWSWGGDGTVCGFSSRGPALEGSIKPDVVAPGNNIVSSYNHFYVNQTEERKQWENIIERVQSGGETYHFGINTGTSMACPVVAGTVALWLEAKPDLTTEDVLGIFQRTSTHLYSTMDYPNNTTGWGEVSPYSGLLDILHLSSVKGVSNEPLANIDLSRLKDGQIGFQLSTDGEQKIDLLVFNTQGAKVRQFTFPHAQGSVLADISPLPSGVYALQLLENGKPLGSTLIRK